MSVADVEIKSLRANSLASEDPGLRQEETAADAFTPGLRHEEESGADVERQRLRAQSPASADPGVRQEETAANVHVKRLKKLVPTCVSCSDEITGCLWCNAFICPFGAFGGCERLLCCAECLRNHIDWHIQAETIGATTSVNKLAR